MSTTVASPLKNFAIRSACTALAIYFRHMPGSLGKSWLWERVARRHIFRRPR